MEQPKKESGAQEGKSSNVTPEQQELYDIFVSQGTMLAAAASDKLKGQGPETPGIVGTVGDAMVDIVNKVEDEGGRRGIQFDAVSMVHGSSEILTNFLNMSGIKLNEDQMKQVIGHMVGRYFQEGIKSGKITKDQLIQTGQQLQQKIQGQKPMQDKQPAAVETPQQGILQKGQTNGS